MEKTITIDGKSYRMRASALIPRLYRYEFGRDMIKDMNQLVKAYNKVKSLPADATDEERQEAQLSVLDLTIFENTAWIMLKHAGEEVGNSPDDWLETIDGVFSVYDVLPTILELWQINQQTTSVPRKK